MFSKVSAIIVQLFILRGLESNKWFQKTALSIDTFNKMAHNYKATPENKKETVSVTRRLDLDEILYLIRSKQI